MDLSQEHREAIEKIIASCECPKNFKCYKTELEKLCRCRIVNIGTEAAVECLEQNSESCIYEISSDNTRYCRCPLRIYIIQKLNK